MKERFLIKDDFGPIKIKESPVSLDIAPFTIFIGENCTGKSFLNKCFFSLKVREDVKSMFIPAERALFFQSFVKTKKFSEWFCGASISDLTEVPLFITNFLFSLEESEDVFKEWGKGYLPSEVKEIEDMTYRELGGKPVYLDGWKWESARDKKIIDLDLASSGQKNVFSIIIFAQSIFAVKNKQKSFCLHVEEPENGLHPSAQIAIAKLLVYLCNKGVRVIVSTHSPFFLYAINNFILAYKTSSLEDTNSLPDVSFRLNPENVSAYLFSEDSIFSIMDENSGELDETQLGKYFARLEEEYLQIQTFGVF